MSAALVDEFSFDGYAVPAPGVHLSERRSMVATRPAAAAPRVAPCDHGVAIRRPSGPSWRLTERGIAVVLALFVTLFVAGLAVLVGSFLAVSDAPLQTTPAVGSAVVSVFGG